MTASLRDRVAAICGALPGAEVSDPWGGGHEAWKVGGKMFACFGAVTEGVSVKCDSIETAERLKAMEIGLHAPYFHKSWVRLPETVAADELDHRVKVSYDLVRAGLPAATRRALPPRQMES